MTQVWRWVGEIGHSPSDQLLLAWYGSWLYRRFVHGDFRRANIMARREMATGRVIQLLMIDLDWAGIEHLHRYREDPNPLVRHEEKLTLRAPRTEGYIYIYYCVYIYIYLTSLPVLSTATAR